MESVTGSEGTGPGLSPRGKEGDTAGRGSQGRSNRKELAVLGKQWLGSGKRFNELTAV